MPSTDQFIKIINEDIVVVPSIEDLPFEEDVGRNQYSVDSWLRYIEFKKESTQKERNFIYERAIRELPKSYKIWHQYLLERVENVRGSCVTDPLFESVNNVFERALVFLDKMPRIWIEYCEFLMLQEKITRTRKTFDRALISLPLTQHPRIWELYLKFILKKNVPSLTCIRVYKRYLKIEPEKVEEYIDYLIKIKEWQEASNQLLMVLEDDKFKSTKGKSKHDLWLLFSDILSSHPKEISQTIRVDPIIRGGIKRFTDQVGKLWCSLADYYIQLAQFEKARDIFEEALHAVVTARDFSFVWESYTQFEDSLIVAKQEILDENPSEESSLEFDIMIERYENLITRQPFLLSSVLLKQNPNNIQEWLKRVKLYQGNAKMIVQTYQEAIEAIDPQQPKGKLYTIWASFAHYYESNKKLTQARQVFENGLTINFKTVDDLASLYCEYAEMELRHKNFEQAIEILKRATVSPKKHIHIADSEPVQKRVFKSIKLWTFYADLEESFGTFHNTQSIYERMMQLKIVTPQIVLNYTRYLEENKYFEDAFKAYEQGIALFPFPHVQDLWITYITRFINRYGGSKLERVRDMFEQVLSKVPAKESIIFYLMYANYEEQYGLARHSMAVYDRATKNVDVQDRYKLYLLYINRASEYFGVTQTREIFTQAIENLPDQSARDICIKFADMERKYGEIDRARSIFVHGSQFSDPRTSPQFWSAWTDFEKLHGNEETFREMLRIKRSVLSKYLVLNPNLNLINQLNNIKNNNGNNGNQNQNNNNNSNNNQNKNNGIERRTVQPTINPTIQNEKEQEEEQEQESDTNIDKNIPKIKNEDEIDIDEEEDDNDGIDFKEMPKTLL
ncbi:hypothetical protein CYY_005042 [Polysphondylium violaceum]|uniref:Pre-mRNA-splicing factor SYF1 n=1 Tax=Polysphondylium violaceum TaxID=133409 RepID=A0A8J4PU54_9MYCE|nr:hypothetical protein CYY_005042 [Polysphondylium violaceum]